MGEPKQKNHTQWNDTSNTSVKPRVTTEVDDAFEKMLDPIAGSPATGKSVTRIINLFVDDLFITGGTEMEQLSKPDLENISKLALKTGVM